MKFGMTLGQLHPGRWEEAAIAADELGFESLWLPEHLVFPDELRGQLVPGEEHPPVPPSTPIVDAPAYLSWLAAKTSRIRLATFVYLLGLRHPFVAARGFATLDQVSGGRAICAVGAGWLLTEWEAVGLDARTRGARLDEHIEVCRRLWTEATVEHHGRFLDFAPVWFEPKPPQQPIPIHIGGESDRAIERTARLGDGWVAMAHTPASIRPRIEALHRAIEATGRRRSEVEVTCMGTCETDADVEAFAAAGVDRLIVVPWRRTSEAVERMATFARNFLT